MDSDDGATGVELVPTGIAGLDAMLYGGIPKDNQTIIAGGPGAGKTLLAFEFLYRGAKAGQTGIFFALEEDPKKIVQNAKNAFLNFDDVDEFIDRGRIIVSGRDVTVDMDRMEKGSSLEFGHMVGEIEDAITSYKATRVVIDSSYAIELIIKNSAEYRRSMWALVANLRRLGVTSILTSELATSDKRRLEFRPEHFIFDGMIVMYQSGEEKRRVQSMEIIKMRGYKHSFVTAPYDITPGGFKVFSPESMTT